MWNSRLLSALRRPFKKWYLCAVVDRQLIQLGVYRCWQNDELRKQHRWASAEFGQTMIIDHAQRELIIKTVRLHGHVYIATTREESCPG